MDAAADDGMQLWTALKREIDITAPSARSHAEDQLKTKTKQKHDETVAEFGLRFRGAVREFKNRGGEMTNYKYVVLLPTSTSGTGASPLNWFDLDPDDDNAIIIPDIIRRTNERASLHDRIIRANPENRRRRLALPVQGRGGGRNGGRTGGRGGRNTERFDPQRHNRRCQNANCRLHTLTTLRCVMRLAARVTTQHVGAATPTQAAEVAVDEADIKVAEADEEDDTRCATDASHHGIGGTQQYLPPPPPLPSRLMQNNIARVGEAFPTMNAPPPTGGCTKLAHIVLEKPKEIGGIKKDSTIKCTHVGKIDFTTHEGTLTVSNAYYGFYFGQIDVETAYLYALLGFKPGEVDIGMYSAAVGTENEIWILVYVDDIIFASKNEQTKDILAGHLRKKYRITEPAQLTWALGMKISFAADGIILTQDLYMSKILERFGFTSAAKSATTPLAHGTTLTRADEEDARRVTSPSGLWVQSSTRQSSAGQTCHRPYE
ncbi:retrotransposon protein [Pseudoscourfieldia marina]